MRRCCTAANSPLSLPSLFCKYVAIALSGPLAVADPAAWVSAVGRLQIIILVLVLAGLVGGGAFLASWDIPAPASTVEKVIPDDRFPR